MTRAPANLLTVRSLLLSQFNIDPSRVREEDLEPAEVGIVGDPAHRGGYHCGSDRVVTNDYSVVESPRDRAGLTDFAAALDVGWFEWKDKSGKVHNLYTFNRWIVGECEKKASDTLDIREIIYTLDGTTVKRWDRLGKRTSGDKSHLYHTHFSFFRDAIKAGKNLTPLFRRYLISIGLIKEAVDLTPEEHNWLATVHKNLTVLDGRNPIGQIYTRTALGTDDAMKEAGKPYTSSHPTLVSLNKQLTAMQTALVAAIQGNDPDVIEQKVNAALVAAEGREIDRHEELIDAIGNVDAEVIEALGAGDREPAEVAALLRAALGDQADAVFQAGLGQS